MTTIVIKPSSWLTTGIRVEKVNNLNLFKFTEELGLRMQELLDQKKADLLTSLKKEYDRCPYRGERA